jgi:hypothetical protein
MGEEILVANLPDSWSVHRISRSRASDGRDLVLSLTAPDGTSSILLVEVKTDLEPRGVPAIARQLDRLSTQWSNANRMVGAAYLSPGTRTALDAHQINWFDATGNLRLALDRPAVFLSRTGAHRDPSPKRPEHPLQTLRGRGAGRVVRMLLDTGGRRRGVRALAADAGVSPATASRVLDLLDRADAIEREVAGPILLVRKRQLVQRWTEDYSLTGTNHAVTALAPRGIDSTMRAIAADPNSYVLAGTAALRAHLAAHDSALTPLSVLTVIVEDAHRATEALRLRATRRGANVVLIEPFDDLIRWNTVEHDGLAYTSPAQTVADLLTGPGRDPEEAAQLINKLAHEDAEWQ